MLHISMSEVVPFAEPTRITRPVSARPNGASAYSQGGLMLSDSEALALYVCAPGEQDGVMIQVLDELGTSHRCAHSMSETLELVDAHDFALILVAYTGDADVLLATVRAIATNARALHTPLVVINMPSAPESLLERLHEAGAISVIMSPLSPVIVRAKARFFIDVYKNQLERRRAELALIDTRERLESIVNAAELGTWTWDLKADRVNADARVAHMFGIEPEQRNRLPMSTWLAAIHPDDAQSTQAMLARSLKLKRAYGGNFRILSHDGSCRWLLVRSSFEFDQQGKPQMVRGVTIDATRQLEAEQQLRSVEERYRTVFELLDEGLVVIDLIYDESGEPIDYVFVEANPAFTRQTGRADIVGKLISELVPDLPRYWLDMYARVVQTGETIRFDNEDRKMGRWYHLCAMRLGPPERRRVAVLFSDITERRKSEAALRQMAAELSEANRLKTEFLATLAHELRNPLAPMRSGLQLIRHAPSDRRATARVHEIIERQLNHLVTLVDDLLDVARITRGRVELRCEPIDICTVIHAALETSTPLIEAARHRLTLHLPNDPILVNADPTRLMQVVSNLLNNAARYTPRGGDISISASREQQQVVVRVTDSGIGIPPHSLEDVFKMFTQVGRSQRGAPGGLGIGLSLVRSLVELHGGTVDAASAGQDTGSTFTVRLPLLNTTAEASARAQIGAGTAATHMRLLVVDDNCDAAETLAALLSMLGHTVSVANDGLQALRMLEQQRADAVLLDLGMPGMSGYEVAAAIRQHPELNRTLLIALTGWGGENDRARTARAGFDRHLTKPASIEAINDVLSSLRDIPLAQPN